MAFGKKIPPSSANDSVTINWTQVPGGIGSFKTRERTVGAALTEGGINYQNSTIEVEDQPSSPEAELPRKPVVEVTITEIQEGNR